MNQVSISGMLVVIGFMAGCSGNPGISSGSNQPTLTSSQVEQKTDSLLYAKGSDTPFTGTIEAHYPSGEKKASLHIENGLAGMSSTWYRSGQKSAEVIVDSGETGHKTEWYENGQMKSDSDVYHGKPHGMTTEWYENGQKKSESNHLREGRKHEEVKTTWHENGQIASEETFRIGLSISKSIWDENGNGGHGAGEALKITDGPKAAVWEYYMDNGKFPADNTSAGLAEASDIRGKYVTSVAIDSGIITATYGDPSDPVAGPHTLVLTPNVDGGYLSWQCSSPDIELASLQQECN